MKNIIKIISLFHIALLVMVLAGCSDETPEEIAAKEARIAHWVKDDVFTVCLGGVKYWYYDGFKRAAMAPKFSSDGKPMLCNKE